MKRSLDRLRFTVLAAGTADFAGSSISMVLVEDGQGHCLLHLVDPSPPGFDKTLEIDAASAGGLDPLRTAHHGERSVASPGRVTRRPAGAKRGCAWARFAPVGTALAP